MKVDAQLIKELRPNFTNDDLIALKAYAKFNTKYHHEIFDQLRARLSEDAVFGPIVNTQTIEQQVQQNEYSHKLQQDAIYNGKWEAYTENLIKQGISYAQVGLQMGAWFSIIKIYKDFAQSNVIKEFPNDIKQAGIVWSGINKLIDYAMSVIAQSYFIEKNKIIQEEQHRKEQALKELKESEERLRALYENSSDRIFIVDEDGMISFINHVSSGQKREAVIGTSFLDYQSEQDRPQVMTALKKVFMTGKSATYEAVAINTKGNTIFASSVAPMFKDGKVYGAAIIARDVTQRRQAEREIRDLNERLEKKVKDRTVALQAEIEQRKQIEEKVIDLNTQLEKKLNQLHATNQELESFSYTVSHDLRAPLRAIDGFSKVLLKKLDGKLDAAQSHYLDVIIGNVGRMGMLIDDLLAFSRMGRLEKKETKFDTEQLVREVFHELMQSQDEYSIALTVNPLPNLKADREMMKQVISNLLGNALKFSAEKEKAKIEVGAKKGKKETTYYIKDNGVGFEMEYADKLFGIFQRLHSDDEFEGTGVGLAIVQRIIHRHNGTVWAEAELNKGATFYFSIPKI